VNDWFYDRRDLVKDSPHCLTIRCNRKLEASVCRKSLGDVVLIDGALTYLPHSSSLRIAIDIERELRMDRARKRHSDFLSHVRESIVGKEALEPGIAPTLEQPTSSRADYFQTAHPILGMPLVAVRRCVGDEGKTNLDLRVVGLDPKKLRSEWDRSHRDVNSADVASKRPGRALWEYNTPPEA